MKNIAEVANLLEDATYLLDKHVCIQNISFDDALILVLSTDGWEQNLDTNNTNILSLMHLITFDNAHLVAQSLKDSDATAAKAVYQELKYWVDNNQI